MGALVGELSAKLTEGFRKKFDGFNLTPPTSAQTAEATSPAGEARKMSAEIISWCPYKKKNFALFDEKN